MQSAAALNTIGIFLKASNLPAFSTIALNPNIRYDPFVVIYVKNVFSGTTEIITNSRNPSWTKLLMIEYKFQERQLLKFKVYYKHPKYEEVMYRATTSVYVPALTTCAEYDR
jgi:Ca2+-dependent lipid-binding protein